MSRESIKKIISITSFILGVGGIAYYGCDQNAAVIIKESLSEKKSLISKIKYIFPDYLYGKGAKNTLIEHQIDNGREEDRHVYTKFINDRINSTK